MTRVLVTGGAGFIGSNLTDRLLAEGHQVTVVDDLSSGQLTNLADARRDPNLPLSFQRVDITSNALDKVLAKAEPEVVLHLAAQVDSRHSIDDPVADAMVNVVGTVNLLECSRRHGVAKVVVTSAGCIYGDPGPGELTIDEEHGGRPTSPFGAGKRAVEEYLHTYQFLHGLRWTSLALGSVYGRRQGSDGDTGVVSVFARRMLDRQPVTIHGDGEQTRDFVYVDDVVHALMLSLDRGDGRRFNIGTGEQTSINELYSHLADITGYDSAPEFGPERAGELRHMALDARLAAAELGWKPWTTLREGLVETVDWLRA